jgi:hypothetical protein
VIFTVGVLRQESLRGALNEEVNYYARGLSGSATEFRGAYDGASQAAPTPSKPVLEG